MADPALPTTDTRASLNAPAEGQAEAVRRWIEPPKFGLDDWNSQHDARREFIDIGGRP